MNFLRKNFPLQQAKSGHQEAWRLREKAPPYRLGLGTRAGAPILGGRRLSEGFGFQGRCVA